MPQLATYTGRVQFFDPACMLRYAFTGERLKGDAFALVIRHWKHEDLEMVELDVNSSFVRRWIIEPDAITTLGASVNQVELLDPSNGAPLPGFGYFLPSKTTDSFYYKSLNPFPPPWDMCEGRGPSCRKVTLNFGKGQIQVFATTDKESIFEAVMSGVVIQRAEIGPLRQGWPTSIRYKEFTTQGTSTAEGSFQLKSVVPSKLKRISRDDYAETGMSLSIRKGATSVGGVYSKGMMSPFKVFDRSVQQTKALVSQDEVAQYKSLANIASAALASVLITATIWAIVKRRQSGKSS